MNTEVEKRGALEPTVQYLKEQNNRIVAVAPHKDKEEAKRLIWRNMMVLNEQMRSNRNLASAKKESVLQAFMEITMLGLEMGSMHEACIIVFAGIAKAIFEYPGLRKLAMNTGKYHDIYVRLVYGKDEFVLSEGTSAGLLHRPFWGPRSSRGKIEGGYMIAILYDKKGRPIKDNPHFYSMRIEDVEALMEKSSGYQYAKNENKPKKSAWLDPEFYPEMVRKTILRRGLKELEKSAELMQALEIESAFEQGRAPIIDIDIEAENNKAQYFPKVEPHDSTAGKIAATFKTQDEVDQLQKEDIPLEPGQPPPKPEPSEPMVIKEGQTSFSTDQPKRGRTKRKGGIVTLNDMRDWIFGTIPFREDGQQRITELFNAYGLYELTDKFTRADVNNIPDDILPKIYNDLQADASD